MSRSQDRDGCRHFE